MCLQTPVKISSGGYIFICWNLGSKCFMCMACISIRLGPISNFEMDFLVHSMFAVESAPTETTLHGLYVEKFLSVIYNYNDLYRILFPQ